MLQFYRHPRVPEMIITLRYGRWVAKWGCETEGWLAVVVAEVTCAATVPHVFVVVVVVVVVVVAAAAAAIAAAAAAAAVVMVVVVVVVVVVVGGDGVLL